MTIGPNIYRPQIDALVKFLIARRIEIGWTQSELDGAIGWSSSLTGHFERGHRQPSLAALIEWANALGCEIDLANRRTPRRRVTESAAAAPRADTAAPRRPLRPDKDSGRGPAVPVLTLLIAERLPPHRPRSGPATATAEETPHDEAQPRDQAPPEPEIGAAKTTPRYRRTWGSNR